MKQGLYYKTKKQVYEILEIGRTKNSLGRITDISLIILIILNVIAVMLDTVKSISSVYRGVLRSFDIISVVIFTIEYILRIWSCNLKNNYEHPFWGRLKFAFTPLLAIDLLAILPFYLPFFFTFDLRILRLIRLIRLFRILKISRYNESINVLIKAIRTRKEQLLMIMFLFSIALIIFSTAVYIAETDAQPNKFSNIPITIYWGLITLTTMGYEDMSPITTWGKFFTAVISLMRIGLFAIPAGIFGSAFVEAMEEKRRKKEEKPKYCPHCKKKL